MLNYMTLGINANVTDSSELGDVKGVECSEACAQQPVCVCNNYSFTIDLWLSPAPLSYCC